MLTLVFAVLLAGGPPADDPQVIPYGRRIDALVEASVPSLPPAKPWRPPASLSLSLSAGWSAWDSVDPYGRRGPSQLNLAGPLVGARAAGGSWYAEFAGQLMRSSLTQRNLTALVACDLFRAGPVRIGTSLEASEVRFRHEDFRNGDILVGTSRTAGMAAAGLTLGVGSYHGASFRVAVLGGTYRNRYGSIIELPDFTGNEALADSESPLYGAKASAEGITIADRVQLGGSVRLLRLTRAGPSSVPREEVSGTASINLRLFSIRRKHLFVGALARFGPAGPSLITDKSFGLRGIWKFR